MCSGGGYGGQHGTGWNNNYNGNIDSVKPMQLGGGWGFGGQGGLQQVGAPGFQQANDGNRMMSGGMPAPQEQAHGGYQPPQQNNPYAYGGYGAPAPYGMQGRGGYGGGMRGLMGAMMGPQWGQNQFSSAQMAPQDMASSKPMYAQPYSGNQAQEMAIRNQQQTDGGY